MKKIFFAFSLVFTLPAFSQDDDFATGSSTLFTIENFPYSAFKPSATAMVLAVGEDGSVITFLAETESAYGKKYTKITEFTSEDMELPFVNAAKMYTEPYYSNDSVVFGFQMPFRASTYTVYFKIEKGEINYLNYDYEDISQEALEAAEEALENDDIQTAVENYNGVMYPMSYFNEADVSYRLMAKAHELAMQAYKSNDFKKAAECMNQAFSFYGNTIYLDYKSKETFEEEVKADVAQEGWNRERFKLWVGDYGLFLYKSGDLQAAETINKYLTTVMPDVAGPYLQLGDTYFDLGKKDLSKKTYKQYASLMKAQKRSKEIPKRVSERCK